MEAKAFGIEVEVVYALPSRQTLLKVLVGAEATVRQAVIDSGVLERHPELDLAQLKVGVFGKRVTLDTRLHAGDRVEIYRPLVADPKDARRKRGQRPPR